MRAWVTTVSLSKQRSMLSAAQQYIHAIDLTFKVMQGHIHLTLIVYHNLITLKANRQWQLCPWQCYQ